MTKEKKTSGVKKRRRPAGGEPGPPSATPNEMGRKRKGARKDEAPRSLPKISKQDVGRDDSTGGGLH